MLYEISDEQKKNMLELFRRVDLKGSEAPAFVDVLNALNNPVEEKKDKK